MEMDTDTQRSPDHHPTVLRKLACGLRRVIEGAEQQTNHDQAAERCGTPCRENFAARVALRPPGSCRSGHRL